MGEQDTGDIKTYEFYWGLQPIFFCECPDGVQRYPDERLERGYVSIDGDSLMYELPGGRVEVRAHDFDEAEDKFKRALVAVGFHLDHLAEAKLINDDVDILLGISRGQGDGGMRHGCLDASEIERVSAAEVGQRDPERAATRR